MHDILTKVAQAYVAPGEAVGVIASQSIGEPSTQFTLNVFHQAGQAQERMTSGMPRLNELVHATVNIRTPVTWAPIAPGRPGPSPAQFVYLPLSAATLDSCVLPTGSYGIDDALLAHVATVFGPESADCSPWVIRFVLDRVCMEPLGYLPRHVAQAIVGTVTGCMSIVYSEPSMDPWVVRVRLRGGGTEPATRTLHATIKQGVVLGGIPGIQSARISTRRTLADDGPTPIVQLSGCGLLALAKCPDLVWSRITTNSVMEVAQVLGLAAARAVLFAEIHKVLCSDGGYVDPRHIVHVVATMSHRGTIMPITRHGINRVDMGLLQRTSFEEPMDMLLQGAMTHTKDPLRGIAECVAMGQKPPFGTGTVGVVEITPTNRADHPERIMVGSREQRLSKKNKFRDNRRRPPPAPLAVIPEDAEEPGAPEPGAKPPRVIVTTDGLGLAKRVSEAAQEQRPETPTIPAQITTQTQVHYTNGLLGDVLPTTRASMYSAVR